MNICIFEDFFIPRLLPVNYFRHTSEIICGAASLKEKIESCLPKKTSLILHTRKSIAALCKEKYPTAKINEFAETDTLFLNSRVVFSKEQINGILKAVKKEKNIAWVQDKFVAAFFTSAENTIKISEAILHDRPEYLVTFSDIEWAELKQIRANDFCFVNYASDLILYNDEELRHDLKRLVKNRKKCVHVSPKSKVSKQAVLDASEGDIYIGKDTIVEPFCYIKGPLYIGEHTTIRSGSSLYGPLSIGNNCKLSGEITSSIIHSYVNKQHHGFLGHSYLCEWVNLGAGTTTSNLKNNYSEITINSAGENVNTNSIFLGSIIGDHTKTGINTMLNTGTQIGISSNLFGSGYHNKLFKSFSWADAGVKELVLYELEKALFTARTSMKRRNVDMTKAYEELFREIYNNREIFAI